jgi:hypothetical protein
VCKKQFFFIFGIRRKVKKIKNDFEEIMNKFLITILSTVCLFMFLFGFACNKPDKNNNGGNNAGIKRYTMEAEYINLDGISGGGHSSEASGVDMIYGDGTDDQKAKGWSNGYFVAFTHREGVEFEFIFNSAEAATGVTIVLRVGSEMGALTFSPSSFSINLNGDGQRRKCVEAKGSC